MKRCTVIVSAMTLFIVGTALAQDQKGHQLTDEMRENLLDKFGDQGIDGDGDGILTGEEVREFFANRNHDGKRGNWGSQDKRHQDGRGDRFVLALDLLEGLEAETAPDGFTADAFPKADENEDGAIDDAEWQAFAEAKRDKILDSLTQHHKGLDADGDGEVDATELEAFKAERVAEASEYILKHNADADQDGDGVLSMEEFTAFREAGAKETRADALKRNPDADVNGDGSLSDDEMFIIKLKLVERGDRAAGRHDGKGKRGEDRRHLSGGFGDSDSRSED